MEACRYDRASSLVRALKRPARVISLAASLHLYLALRLAMDALLDTAILKDVADPMTSRGLAFFYGRACLEELRMRTS